jgi:hypothetical protein
VIEVRFSLNRIIDSLKLKLVLPYFIVGLTALWTSLVSYGEPFYFPEESLAVDPRAGWEAIKTGVFPASGYQVNSTALIAIVELPVYIVLELFGFNGWDNYTLRLALRASVASVLLFGLLKSLTFSSLGSLVGVLTIQTTFFFMLSLAFTPMISSLTLLAGGFLALKIMSQKLFVGSFFLFAILFWTIGITSNLAYMAVGGLFLPLSLTFFMNIERLRLTQLFKIYSIALFLIILTWAGPLWRAYFQTNSISELSDYAVNQKFSLIESTGWMRVVLGGGHWADAIYLGEVQLYGAIPSTTGLLYLLRTILVLVALVLGFAVLWKNTLPNSPKRRLLKFTLIGFLFSFSLTAFNPNSATIKWAYDNFFVLNAYRWPWSKFMPLYLLFLSLLISLILSIAAISNKRGVIKYFLVLLTLFSVSIGLYFFEVQNAQKSWKSSTKNHINIGTEWMLYTKSNLRNYENNILKISQMAQNDAICLDFPTAVSNSFRRDITALVENTSKNRVFMIWEAFKGRVPIESLYGGCLESIKKDNVKYDKIIILFPTHWTDWHPNIDVRYKEIIECFYIQPDLNLSFFEGPCVEKKMN